MKKKTLLFTAITAFLYITMSSYNAGPAVPGGQNRTGAKASGTNCSTGGCHGTGTATTVAITIDSGTTPVTKYTPGITYKVKITGTNSASHAKFGFQYAVVSGTGAAQVQAGTFPTALPASVAKHAFSGLDFIEHSTAITSATPGTYSVTFDWKAPATAAGNITMYCTLNAVDGDGFLSAGDVSANVSKVLAVNTVAPSSIAAAAGNSSITAFPNPVSNNLNIQLDNVESGMYSIRAYNLAGKLITHENTSVNSASQVAAISTSNWAPGTYMIAVEKDGIRKIIPVVKN